MNKILYIQYANPGHYPPLIHSSKILADHGWKVFFLGTGALYGNNLDFPSHPNISKFRWPWISGGWLQKIYYVLYGIHALSITILWRPKIVYASDPLICPIALALKKITGVKVIYHEHDSPEG